MKLEYKNLEAFGCRRSNRHLTLMRTLTRAGYPIIRSRGLDIIARNLRRLLGADQCFAKIELTPDARFAFPVYDSYWGSHIYRHMPYEPALARLFARLARLDFAFVDCGANFGFWSAVITSKEFGAHDCVAIESSSETYAGLLQTAALNGNRFKCIHKAVWDRGAKSIGFREGGRHAGRHVASDDVNAHPANAPRLFTPIEHEVDIETISIDEVANSLDCVALLVKIDVEGSELHAIDGATESAAQDSVFVYEDHGADRENRVTAGLLNRGFQIYLPDAAGRVERITKLGQLTAIKSNTRNGYNLLATRGAGPFTRAATASA